MSIDAMKQALEALGHASWDEEWQALAGSETSRALIAAIEQAEKQEAWKPSDTAYRPQGLPQDFTKHEVDAFDDWSEWVCPDPAQYFMKCCGCGLVHEMQFKIVKYSEGDECEAVDDPAVQAVFRARQFEDSEKQEPVAWVRWDDEENYYDVRRTPPPQEAIDYLAKWNRPAWVPAYPHPPQKEKQEPPQFPTMLRKMWTGSEVQAWINENWQAPPQRQPLTPAQLIECMEAVNVYGTKYIEFARAIERKHGIGGGE